MDKFLFDKVNLLMLKSISLSLLLLVAITNGQAKNISSLCTAKEKVVFSCELHNKKLISVCASPDLSKDKGYLYYIAGKPNKIDMKYPQNKQHPADLFGFGYASHQAKLDGYYLSFSKNKIIYAIYSEFTPLDQKPYQRGVLSYKAGDEYALSDQRCKYVFKDKLSKLNYMYHLELGKDDDLINPSDAIQQSIVGWLPILKSESDAEIKEIERDDLQKKLQPPTTLCLKQEKVIFSCHFKNKKIVSLCASADLSKTKGYLHYLYGNQNEIKVKYPAVDNIKPQALFNAGSLHGFIGDTAGDYISFSKNKVEYIIYAIYGGFRDRGINHFGLITQNQCDTKKTIGIFSKACNKRISLIDRGCKNYSVLKPDNIWLGDLGFMEDDFIKGYGLPN